MLVIEDGFGGVQTVNPSWRDRVAAHALTDRLDRDLAAGASPDSSARLALRARWLTSTPARRGLERSVRRILGRSLEPASTAGPVPFARRAVIGSATQWAALAERLGRSGPVAVGGVARASVLLSEVWGPASRGCTADELRDEVRAATEALSLVTEN